MSKIFGQRYVITRDNKIFPNALRKIPDPPSQLYLIGNPNALQEGLGIVGARNASPYGLSNVEHFGGIAAELGICLISGGAYGCDSAAHKAALHKGATTVVFLGGGCDNPYPARNIKLFQQVVDCGGAIVSEKEWTYENMKHTFLARNRLIAGMSKALLVAEAGLPSGTFTTANFAIEAGKEVWTIPGSISFSGSLGCNTLIYDGATPIISDDVFKAHIYDTFGLKTEDQSTQKIYKKGQKIGDTKNPILEAITAQPLKSEQLFEIASKHCGNQEPHSWLASMLVEAENSGKIAKYKDGTYGPVVC